MSYLDLPRFHVFGEFYANPSTINNQAVNYNPAQPLNNEDGMCPGSRAWDPSGVANFKMVSTVQTVLDADGNTVSDDALLRATLASVDAPATAKLVDLDPQQQGVTGIYGLRLALTLSTGEVAFSGPVMTSSLAHLWGRVIGGGNQGIETAGGMFQTVIHDVQWGDLSSSPVLQALRRAAYQDRLSIKWVLDGFNGDLNSLDFGTGRMVATVGPYLQDEPCHSLAQRLLQPPAASDDTPNGLWFTPFQVVPSAGAGAAEQKGALVLDLGNAVATQRVRGGPPFYSQVRVFLDGARHPVATIAVDDASYRGTAGIVTVSLSGDQLESARTRPIRADALPNRRARTRGKLVTPINTLAEPSDGRWAAAEPAVLRLQPGQPRSVTVWARAFGLPVDTGSLDLRLTMIPNSDGTAVPANVGSLDDSFSFPPSPPFENGRADFQVSATGRGQKPPSRAHVDGNLYFLVSSWWPDVLTGGGSPLVSALAFEWFPPLERPTWRGDIQPILAQYTRLYPGMRSILDMADLPTLQNPFFNTGHTGAQLVANALSRSVDDPAYMPVTRDLSDAKRQAILTWISNGVQDGGNAPPAPPTETMEECNPPEELTRAQVKTVFRAATATEE